MEIVKVFNNNVISLNDNHQEEVVMGWHRLLKLRRHCRSKKIKAIHH